MHEQLTPLRIYQAGIPEIDDTIREKTAISNRQCMRLTKFHGVTPSIRDSGTHEKVIKRYISTVSSRECLTL